MVWTSLCKWPETARLAGTLGAWPHEARGAVAYLKALLQHASGKTRNAFHAHSTSGRGHAQSGLLGLPKGLASSAKQTSGEPQERPQAIGAARGLRPGHQVATAQMSALGQERCARLQVHGDGAAEAFFSHSLARPPQWCHGRVVVPMWALS